MPKEQIFEIKKQEKLEVPEKETEPEIVWSPEAEKEGEKLVMQISSLKESLNQAEEKGDLKEQAKILDQIDPLVKRLEILTEEETILFEQLTQKELKEQYESQKNLCRERGFLQTFPNGQEGIKDEEGNEYPFPDFKEIMTKLKKEDLYQEKIEIFEKPLILITPFALSPKKMANEYSKQIEEHFVEERVDGERRIPNKNKTKLFGVNKDPLELRTDKENVYFDDSLKNLLYFPEWKEQAGAVKPVNGISKKQAIDQIGGWKISIIENIPLVPQKGQGETKQKEIKIKGKTKLIKRKPVEGGMNAAEQYNLLKQQNEQGLTIEDQIFYSMLYLRENNIVLDDDQRTNYYCRILGNCASGYVPGAGWIRDSLLAFMYRYSPGNRYDYCGARSAVMI